MWEKGWEREGKGGGECGRERGGECERERVGVQENLEQREGEKERERERERERVGGSGGVLKREKGIGEALADGGEGRGEKGEEGDRRGRELVQQ